MRNIHLKLLITLLFISCGSIKEIIKEEATPIVTTTTYKEYFKSKENTYKEDIDGDDYITTDIENYDSGEDYNDWGYYNTDVVINVYNSTPWYYNHWYGYRGYHQQWAWNWGYNPYYYNWDYGYYGHYNNYYRPYNNYNGYSYNRGRRNTDYNRGRSNTNINKRSAVYTKKRPTTDYNRGRSNTSTKRTSEYRPTSRSTSNRIKNASYTRPKTRPNNVRRTTPTSRSRGKTNRGGR
jgi:hypothetical protein